MVRLARTKSRALVLRQIVNWQTRLVGNVRHPVGRQLVRKARALLKVRPLGFFVLVKFLCEGDNLGLGDGLYYRRRFFGWTVNQFDAKKNNNRYRKCC